ncbi:MAG: hypothetical protein IJ507_02720 [Clostridia bacterium]|nr:hypothetical protein [Clostridia bacterium]
MAMHRARVVAIGGEKDMIRLCQVMLNNSDWMDDVEDTEDRPPLTLEELISLIRTRAQVEGGPECEFYYGMLTQRIYGQAEADSCRMHIRQEPCGLWTATFAYASEEPFQQEDWMRFHLACGRLPMLALRASEDYALAKGMLIFTGGRMLENWERMDECWMYLISQYECGYPPEEAVGHLRRLEEMLEMEESDLTVDELLVGCMDNLQDIADHAAAPETVQEMMQQCLAQKDYQGLFVLQCRVAEAALWDIEHIGRYLATLETVRKAWQEA